MPDEHDYPTDEELSHFDKWKLGSNLADFRPAEVVDYLESIWHIPDWGFTLKEGRDRIRRKVMRLSISTGGWSGNEDIIEELKTTFFCHLIQDILGLETISQI